MAFPNLKNKYLEDSVFSPVEFVNYHKKNGRCPKTNIPEGVIICYDRKLLDFITERHKTKQYAVFDTNLHVLREARSQVAVIGNFGIGAPAASVVLEELIALGAKSFITIGTAGALQRNLKVGDLVVCKRAIRDEGTSYHYLKYSKYTYASKDITREIKSCLDKFKQKYIVGTSWTVDTPFRETTSEVKQYQKEGILTVEMEASALFAVAQYRGVDIGAVFALSDSLSELEWEPRFHVDKIKKSLKVLYMVALDVLW